MEATWKKARVTPAPPAGDAEFLRRVTLDLAGRVPTIEEAERFLADAAADKRQRLVDALLTSPDHAEHWADVAVDLFVRPEFRRPGMARAIDLRSYFVTAARENRPYDRMATEMLTFSGPLEPDGPGAFLTSQLRAGGPETLASATARVFLGLQIQCAQCHDHPTDARYKRADFYGLVAYFAKTRARPAEGKRFAVVEKARGEAAFDGTVVPPKFLGRAVEPAEQETSRQALARAVVSSDLFAKAAVDRLWAQLFGRGLVEPWDDLGGERDPGHPELLVRLARGLPRQRLRRSAPAAPARAVARVRCVFCMWDPGRVPPPATGSGERSSPAPTRSRRVRGFRARAGPASDTGAAVPLAARGHRGRPMSRTSADAYDKKIRRLLREYLFVFGDDEMGARERLRRQHPAGAAADQRRDHEPGRPRPAGWNAGPDSRGDRDPAARLRRLFLATTTRLPSDGETKRLLPELIARPEDKQRYEDLFYALLISTEMSTNH